MKALGLLLVTCYYYSFFLFRNLCCYQFLCSHRAAVEVLAWFATPRKSKASTLGQVLATTLVALPRRETGLVPRVRARPLSQTSGICVTIVFVTAVTESNTV